MKSLPGLIICGLATLVLSLPSLQMEALVASAKAMGMGQTGVAYPQDALTGAYNPAGIVNIGRQWDVGLIWQRDSGEALIKDNVLSSGTFLSNRKPNVVIPEFGINYLSCQSWKGFDWSVGFLIYNKNLINAHYSRTIPLFGTSSTKLLLCEEIAAPTLAFRYNKHSFGIAINAVAQYLKLEGFQDFDITQITSQMDKVSNNGWATAYGIGALLGYLWQATPSLSLGFTYETKPYMGKLKKYAGFLVDGKIGLPDRFSAGLAYQPLPKMHLTADIQYIRWSNVDTLGSISIESALDIFDKKFGESGNGFGFAWKNQTLVHVGADYAFAKDIMGRVGYMYETCPISKEAFANIATIKIVEHYLTLGGTWKRDRSQEISAFYIQGIQHSIKGNIDSTFGGGTVSLKGNKIMAGVSYTRFY